MNKKKIKKTIEALRKEAEAKIKEADKLVKAAKELEKNLPQGAKSVLKQLNKEFQVLEEGITLEWHPSLPPPPTIQTQVRWLSGMEVEFEENIYSDLNSWLEEYVFQVEGEWERWIERHPKVKEMNHQIKDLCNRSDKQAKKFGIDGEDFFEMVMEGK